MTMYWFELVILIITTLFCDVWFYKKMQEKHYNKGLTHFSLYVGAFFIIFFLYIRFGFIYNHNYKFSSYLMWLFLVYTFIYIPKAVYILFDLLNSLYNRIFKKQTKFIRQIGLIGILISLIFLIYGTIVTRKNIKVVKKEISVKNLPPAFNGYKIVVFADTHFGNWNNDFSIAKPLIDSINQLQPDIIVFAGDVVNNFADELNGWEFYLKQLKSKQGNFAILGNHDYGDYTRWHSDAQKAENLKGIEQNIRNSGFNLLLNENQDITKGSDKLTIVGVENWNSHEDKNYCNLNKALQGTNPNRKKILLSHNPTEWDKDVKGKRNDIFLTISGHTHAGQIAIIAKKFHFSPIEIKFNEWQGLYQKGEQYIYVNAGIGFVGIPLRIGAHPEITILTLKNEN